MTSLDRAAIAWPAWFSSDGSKALRRLHALRRRRSLATSDFDKGVYGHPEVKKALWKAQHRKCAWCETKVEARTNHVDHFRPKSRARGRDGSFSEGYWWLAYARDNLMFSCSNCNIEKGDWFPLAKGATKLRRGDDPATIDEKPRLIDPSRQDPSQYLTFVRGTSGWHPAPRNKSARGRWTRDVLALDRDELTELRADYVRDVLRPVRRRFGAAQTPKEKQQAKHDAQALVKPDREYSLLARE